MKKENRTKPTLLRCRLSATELQKHKALVKSLDVTSQEYLYLHVLNYTPKSDPRLPLVTDLQKYIDKANDITWKMKLYIESDPMNPHPEVRYWSADVIKEFLKRLFDLLSIDINPRLTQIQNIDPHIKLIREEVRTLESELLDKVLFVRVKPEDKEIIKANAKQCMLSVSSYIRFIATGKQPQSRDCLIACRSMAKVSGDLGRIKGIMRYWIATDSKFNPLPLNVKRLILDNARAAIIDKMIAFKIMDQFSYMLS